MTTYQQSSLWTATLRQKDEKKKPRLNTDNVSQASAESAFKKQADDSHTFKRVVEDSLGFFPR